MLQLAPYAAHPDQTRGRRTQETAPAYRSEYQRDRDRIVHSAAFRRLEYKTQVFVNHEGDMFRTRLTHSIEVAQIARSVARALALNEDLAEAVSLAHDLGHTPFGHAGQDVLNACMREYGGFEHNLQSLRVVDELEERYAEFQGLNLTFETREGILKHCSPGKARELGDLGARFLNKTQPSLEAQLANLADEIAYNNHDVDDGLRAGLITIEQLNEIELFREQYNLVTRSYPALPERRTVHEVIRRMINRQITDLLEASRDRIAGAAPADIESVRTQSSPLIGFGAEMREQGLELKRFLRENLYRHYRVIRMTAKAGRILRALFEAFMEEPGLLPPEPANRLKTAVAPGVLPPATLVRPCTAEQILGMTGRARIITDYIAGMTDRYAIAEYDRVFNPSYLS